MSIGSKIGKGLINVLTTDNKFADGGGFSSYLVPKKLSGVGIGVVIGGSTLYGVGKPALQSRNRVKAGDISYLQGMTRMTGTFNTGVVPAMKNISNGDYEIFSDLAKDVVSSPKLLGKIDDYGVTPQFISALYNMG